DGLASVGAPLTELEFESCLGICSLVNLTRLDLTWLGLNDCGRIDSLHPIAALQRLERFHAWESTRILDDDLTPLIELPALRKIAMRDRATYRPRVREIQRTLDLRSQ